MRVALGLILALTLHAAAPLVKVQLGKSVAEMPLERYVAAVLAGEAGGFQSREALMAMAVAARTYAVRHRGRHAAAGFDFCNTTHCQYVNPSAASRLESVAAETAGELLWFEGKPAFTPYSADCGGRTESAAAIWPSVAAPYLKSSADPYCARNRWQWSADAQQIAAALQRAALRFPKLLEQIEIVERTPSGRARTLMLAGGGEAIRISASSFRFAIGRDLGWNTVRSEAFDVTGRFNFSGSGAGHGVGLCQRGAEQMGRAGRTWREILAHYYPGATPGVTARGFDWQRLGGEHVSLLTTRPDLDRFLIAPAERQLRALADRTGWAIPHGVEIRVYPDVSAFRDATGEPGWVAGYTEGRRIHLQPEGAALAHELAHAMIESQAASGLPLWFREGLAGYLERPTAGSAPAPSEAALRERNDAARARRAHAEATAAVTGLVKRYGETAVLDWVKRGLPPAVRNASTSSAPTKRK